MPKDGSSDPCLSGLNILCDPVDMAELSDLLLTIMEEVIA